jgi:hypothetical protein
MQSELIPEPFGLPGLSSISALETVDRPRHRWYFLKEAFSPEIVSHAIAASGCVSGDVVFDPFSGSGTTPLEAKMHSLRASGVEVNPFLRFVAQTKLRHCSEEALRKHSAAVLRGIMRGAPSPLEEFSTFSELAPQGLKNGKWLFNSDVLRAFEGGWTAVGAERTAQADFSRLCLIGAAMDVANAVKDGKCLRYRPDWAKLSFRAAQFAEAYSNRIAAVATDLEIHPMEDASGLVSLGDARSHSFEPGFKLCITSPPYLNSFDYTDIYRPELFLGRFVKTMQDLRSLRFRTLRSHVQVAWKDPIESAFGRHYADAITHISKDAEGLWNPRIPRMIQAYFEDMAVVLRRLRERARSDASLWIVVSTSAYGGVEIPVDLILADIACLHGWCLREVSVLRYLGRVAGQQWAQLSERNESGKPHLRESVVILDACPKRGTKPKRSRGKDTSTAPE